MTTDPAGAGSPTGSTELAEHPVLELVGMSGSYGRDKVVVRDITRARTATT